MKNSASFDTKIVSLPIFSRYDTFSTALLEDGGSTTATNSSKQKVLSQDLIHTCHKAATRLPQGYCGNLVATLWLPCHFYMGCKKDIVLETKYSQETLQFTNTPSQVTKTLLHNSPTHLHNSPTLPNTVPANKSTIHMKFGIVILCIYTYTKWLFQISHTQNDYPKFHNELCFCSLSPKDLQPINSSVPQKVIIKPMQKQQYFMCCNRPPLCMGL